MIAPRTVFRRALCPGLGGELWLALAIPPLAWFVYEIGLGSTLRFACGAAGSWLGIGWGAASLAACGFAAWLGSAAMARGGAEMRSVSFWAGRIALALAALFALAILFQLFAVLIVPACVA